MEATGLQRLGQLDRMARPLDVRLDLAFGARREVVERGKMEEVSDLSVETLNGCRSKSTPRLADITDDRYQAFLVGAETIAQGFEFRYGFLAYQTVDSALRNSSFSSR